MEYLALEGEHGVDDFRQKFLIHELCISGVGPQKYALTFLIHSFEPNLKPWVRFEILQDVKNTIT